MDLLLEIGLGLVTALCGIIGFFLKKALNDIDGLKDMKGRGDLIDERIKAVKEQAEKNEELIYKKHTTVLTKLETQNELNSVFKETLASINAKLDILLSK